MKPDRPIVRVIQPPPYTDGFTSTERGALAAVANVAAIESVGELRTLLTALARDERPDRGDAARRNADRHEASVVVRRALDRAVQKELATRKR